MKDWAKRELRVICFTAKHGTLKDRNKDRSVGIHVSMFAMVEHSHMSKKKEKKKEHLCLTIPIIKWGELYLNE
jgi:hypothetical protein